MSHIFISYSHKDKNYVEKLEKKLIEEGFHVWIDHRIDYGSQWTQEVENAIDTCDAYIVVMSENAKKSPWVQREVIHAERRKKPFFPLLLSGEFWFSLGDIQFADVSNGSLPPEKYYWRLEKVSQRRKEKTPPPPYPSNKTPRYVNLNGMTIMIHYIQERGRDAAKIRERLFKFGAKVILKQDFDSNVGKIYFHSSQTDKNDPNKNAAHEIAKIIADIEIVTPTFSTFNAFANSLLKNPFAKGEQDIQDIDLYVTRKK